MAAGQSFITPDQYLEIERNAECKSEYISGQMIAKAGPSKTHGDIISNIHFALISRLLGKNCKPITNEFRVQVDSAGPYLYPDVVVYCNDAKWIDKHLDTLTNPHVIFEVLSPSTEHYDRGEKFFHYRRINELTDYILVSQKGCLVEHYHREGNNWLLTEIIGYDNVLNLTSIELSLPIGEIYMDIEFPPAFIVNEPPMEYDVRS